MPHHAYRPHRVKLRSGLEPMGTFEYATVLIASYVAGGVYVWPRSLCLIAGSNGIVALVLTGLWGLFILGGVAYWASVTPGKTAYQKLERTSGRFWSVLIAGIAGILTMTYIAAIGALYITVLTTVVIPGHRAWALGVILMGYIFWLGTRPPISVIRLFTLTIPGLTLLTLITVGLGFDNVQFPNALRPHVPIQWGNVYDATVSGTYFWVPILPLATAVGLVRDRFPSKVMPTTLWTVVVQIFLLLLLYSLAVMTLGPEGVAHATWPIVFVFENIDLSNFFITEIGLGVAIIWTVSFIGFIAWHVWHQSLLIEHVWKKRPGGLNPWVIALVIAAAAILVMRLSLNPETLEAFLLNTLAPINFWFSTIWVSIAVILTLWKRRQSHHGTASNSDV